ncbi:cytochrome P450 [Karstenula rhodostoma CBS 690.94]|uniref:Cytochrome P450 n=1 Tax=Karstenula rhodostoma CBS 690.94 TaxID=1392251 RepID=A0A9P4PI42_9PLEO|nr:cytochrome P450 [Karstenula rhodostoma CBS 690.94]
MYTILLSLAALLTLLYRYRNAGRRPKDLPPGPPTIPFLGNLHQIPATKAWHQFKAWADEYGPIYSLMLGPSTVMIVLSSDEVVKELLDRRSGNYSSRPPLYIGQMISGWMRMLLMEYGKTWRFMRSLVHDHLNVKASISYVPYQDLENRQMLLGFLESPGRWVDHIRRYTNALTTQMVFGFRTVSIDDENMHTLFECVEDWATTFGTVQAQLLDIFPVLQRLPDFLVPVKRKAKALHAKELKLYLLHWNALKRDPCFAADVALAQAKAHSDETLTDAQASYLLGSLHEAGSDTTWSTLLGFIQALLLFPSVALTAQAEIDRLCGDRLPTMDDEPHMQYIRGCVKESLRWMPTPILGMVRSPVREDVYEGYRIPKGATVVMNVWALHNNDSRFPNPRAFDPSRYAHDTHSAFEAAHAADFAKRDHYTFGAGRRSCQGMHIAERSLFLAIARLLWAFDFRMAKDDAGNDIVPDADALTDGVLVRPEGFPVVITPRSEEKAEAVRREWARVEGKLDERGQWMRVPEGMFSKEYVPLVG